MPYICLLCLDLMSLNYLYRKRGVLHTISFSINLTKMMNVCRFNGVLDHYKKSNVQINHFYVCLFNSQYEIYVQCADFLQSYFLMLSI